MAVRSRECQISARGAVLLERHVPKLCGIYQGVRTANHCLICMQMEGNVTVGTRW